MKSNILTNNKLNRFSNDELDSFSSKLDNSGKLGKGFVNKGILMILAILLIIVLLPVNISAAGVTPAYYIVDFKPGYEGNFIFNFIFDSSREIETYIAGDLAEYIELDKDFLTGGGEVVAHMKLPNKIGVPGQHRIRIGAKQIPKEEGGLEVVGDVGGIIKVNVPYPGKHLDGEFYISNANVGEDVKIRLIVKNNGEENVYISPVVKIYNSEKEIEILQFEERLVEKTISTEYDELLSTKNITAGDYNASAVIAYDSKELELKTGFRLGDFYVDIMDYTKEFERNKVNRFEIDVLSFYNKEIKNLYANISILGEEGINFLTPSMSLKAWEGGRLEGFFDTSEIKPSKFEAEIILYYDGGITKKIVQLRYAGEIEAIWYFAGGAVAAILFGLSWWFIRNKKWKIKSKKK